MQVPQFVSLIKFYLPWMEVEHITVIIILILTVIVNVVIYYARKTHISNPTDVKICDVTYESVTLEWTKPNRGARHVISYTVLCQSDNGRDGEWQSKATSTEETAVVKGLEPRTTYRFKVRPERNGKHYKESGASESVTTEPKFPGEPASKPVLTQVRQNSVTLTWGKPVYGEDLVVKYVVHYRPTEVSPGEWEKTGFKRNICTAIVEGLNPDTEYEFKVVPEGEHGSECESKVSDSIRTIKVLAIRMKEQSTEDSTEQSTESDEKNNPPKYILPMEKDGTNRYIIGDPSPYSPTDQKVLMLLGATGAGKTTLINGIVNYYLNVSIEHHFRFKLAEKVRKTQAHSQTSEVIAYTFYPMDGSRIPYVLTIIDTPGFADTRGINRDRKTLCQINDFLAIGEKYGINHFNGVGVVVQAALSRLTAMQTYIFDSVLSVLAKDVATNMFLMITFADSQRPPCLSGIEEVKMPYRAYFKFNNSALFADLKDDDLARGFWDLGMKNFDKFFDQFGKIKEVSIDGVKTVLMDREQLRTIIEELQKKIAFGLESIDILSLEKRRLEDHKGDMLLNKDFTYEMTSTTRLRENIPGNQKALNCQNCFSTCHYPCELQPDEGVRSCAVIKSSYCTICPKKCTWECHKVQGFVYKLGREKKQMENKRLKSQYDDAKAKYDHTSEVVTKLEEDLSKARIDVLYMIEQARECKERLNEMALKPEALTTGDYMDILIQSEKSEKKEGYLQRVEALQGLKKSKELHEMLSTGEGTFKVMNNFW